MTNAPSMLTPKTLGGRNLIADECDRFANQLYCISDTLLCASDLYRDELGDITAPVMHLQKSLQLLSVVIMEAYDAWSDR